MSAGNGALMALALFRNWSRIDVQARSKLYCRKITLCHPGGELMGCEFAQRPLDLLSTYADRYLPRQRLSQRSTRVFCFFGRPPEFPD